MERLRFAKLRSELKTKNLSTFNGNESFHFPYRGVDVGNC